MRGEVIHRLPQIFTAPNKKFSHLHARYLLIREPFSGTISPYIQEVYKKKLLLAAALAFSAAVPAFAEITATDVVGRTVTVPKVPERIVLGFYYEDYLAIGGKDAVDKVVALALSTWKDWRPQQYARYEKALPKLKDIPDIGNTEDGTFSVEKIIATNPDLVILGAWNYEALGESVKQFDEAGIPYVVLDYNAQTVEKHTVSTLALGKLLGQEQRAQELADNYKNAFADIEKRIEKLKPSPKKVYVELAQNGAETFGNSYGNTMWGALLEKLGGKNIAAGQVKGAAPLSPEYILAEAPDLIFLAGSEWKNKPQAVAVGFSADPKVVNERIAAYLQRPGWADLPAVKTDNVFALYHGGARTLSDYVYAQFIAKQLYPEAFKDVDPVKNLQEYYKKWLPIEADGVFMTQYQPAK